MPPENDPPETQAEKILAEMRSCVFELDHELGQTGDSQVDRAALLVIDTVNPDNMRIIEEMRDKLKHVLKQFKSLQKANVNEEQ